MESKGYGAHMENTGNWERNRYHQCLKYWNNQMRYVVSFAWQSEHDGNNVCAATYTLKSDRQIKLNHHKTANTKNNNNNNNNTNRRKSYKQQQTRERALS